MDPFIAKLRQLHDKAKTNTLTESEHAEYERARGNLGSVLLVAQQIGQQGRTLRAALRMTTVVKVEIDLGGFGPEKTTTIDVSQGGFAALLGSSQEVGKPTLFVLHLPDFNGGVRRVSGSAKVASSRPHGSLHRVSFTFSSLSSADRRHLDITIVDAVLARLPA